MRFRRRKIQIVSGGLVLFAITIFTACTGELDSGPSPTVQAEVDPIASPKDNESNARVPLPPFAAISPRDRFYIDSISGGASIPEQLLGTTLTSEDHPSTLTKCYEGDRVINKVDNEIHYRLELYNSGGALTVNLSAVVIKESHALSNVHLLGAYSHDFASMCGPVYASKMELGGGVLFSATYWSKRIGSPINFPVDQRFVWEVIAGSKGSKEFNEDDSFESYLRGLKKLLDVEYHEGSMRVVMNDPRSASSDLGLKGFSMSMENLRGYTKNLSEAPEREMGPLQVQYLNVSLKKARTSQ